MSLPCEVDELREVLNHYVELCEENDDFKNQAVKDAKTISGLRRRIGELMEELKQKPLT